MTDILSHAFDNPIFPAIGLALGATAGALWIAAAWWAYRDAAWRTGSPWLGMVAAGWIVLSSPLLVPLSVGVYTLIRPQHTAAEGRSRRLVEELVERLDADGRACPACASAIDAGWLRCPACSTWLAAPCAHCATWSDIGLEICPWCGSDQRELPDVVLRTPAVAPAKAAGAPAKAAMAPAKAGGERKSRRRQPRRQPVPVMAGERRQARARLEALLDARPPARAGS